jgi:hypothetical protein
MDDADWLAIDYRGFYDLPRLIRVGFEGAVLFFDCSFNEALDDYEDHYTVYRVGGVDAQHANDWRAYLTPANRIGTIKVGDLQLDRTLRQYLHRDTLSKVAV